MTDAPAPAPAGPPANASAGGINPVIYLFAVPAAVTLLSGLNEVIDLSELMHRLIRVWRAATHWIWDAVFGWVSLVIPFKPTPMQKDGLTLAMMFLGAGLAPIGPKQAAQGLGAVRKGAEQWLFLAALACVLGVFLFPYLGEIGAAMTSTLPGWLHWASPVFYFFIVVMLGVFLWMLAFVLPDDSRGGLSVGGESDRFATALYVGFTLSAMTFFVQAYNMDAFRPETASKGVLGGIADWFRTYWSMLTSARVWTSLIALMVLSLLFAVGFALMYARNPRAVIRIVAVGVGLFVADRIIAAAQPSLPGLIAVLEEWERGLSATPVP